jgi:catechol 2,3-dioxygenase-like lactoylglutathione lyase family enzyme
MENFIKSAGIFHVGFGVRDLEVSRKFYQETMGFTEMVECFDQVNDTMADTFRNTHHVLSGYMFHHRTGGLTLEPIQLQCPTPRAIFTMPQLGDIGPNKVTFAVSNVEKFVTEYQEKVKFLGEPQSVTLPGFGEYTFVFGRDPDNNILEFASWDGATVDQGGTGGIRILGLAVTEMERSKAFYQKHCDMDVVVSEHDRFSGLVSAVSGSPDTRVKSCLLDCGKGSRSPFGTAMLELYEVSSPRGRSIPFGTQWGDFGFMETSTVALGSMYQLAQYYEKEGIEIVQRPTTAVVNKEEGVEYWFMYVRDPDGNFVETVGIHSIR